MSVATGRTVWIMKDAAWWRREYVVALGEEFGPAGPAVLDWLACEAKAQNDGGWVKAGPRAIARGTFIDVDTVCHVLSRAVTWGALDDYREADGRFVCRISGWASDQERGRAVNRQAAKRDRDRAQNPDEQGLFASTAPVTERDVSRPVTPRHAASREEKRREEKNTPRKPPKGGSLPVPTAPRGKRGRDRERYDAEVRAFASDLFPAAHTDAAYNAVRGALARIGGDPVTRDVVHRLAEPYLVETQEAPAA